MIDHGGRLKSASSRYNIPEERWVDLSTAISPWAYPAPAVPTNVWRRLPEEEDDLVQAAANYYQCLPAYVLPVPGTQWAIQAIPHLYPGSKVGIPSWGYREHEQHWRAAGHEVVYYRHAAHLLELLERSALDHVVLINPNNPTAELIESSTVASMRERIPGLLLVDEAFMDGLPEHSAILLQSQADTLVLRSIGKFFGLAGLRLGFVMGTRGLLDKLNNKLPLWSVSHPARWLASIALADGHWQNQHREKLEVAADRWRNFITSCFPNANVSGLPLFVSAKFSPDVAAQVYTKSAERGLLLRHYGVVDNSALIRFGLPNAAELPVAERTIKAISSLSNGAAACAQ